MKKLLLISALALFASAAKADTSTVTVGGINLSDIFSEVRGGYFQTFQGMALTTLYAPVVSLHDSAGLELINLDAGAALKSGSAKGSPFFALGLRLDGFLSKFANASPWIKTHVSAASLPPIECGAALSWYSPEHIWVWGVSAAFKFGK